MGLTTAKKLVLFGRPGWVLPEAALDFDFANDRYWVGGGVRPSSFISLTRASTGMAQNSAGVWSSFGSGVPRITDLGFLIEEARTNKCTNYNANPSALVTMGTAAAFNAAVTNVVAANGDGNSLFGVVDDSAEIAAAGLQNVSNGRVYKIDNTTGAVTAQLQIAGTVGNTNAHSISAYARITGGTGSLTLFNTSTQTFTNSSYTRVTKANLTPAASTNFLLLSAPAGTVVYFTLNDLEEGSFVTSPIIVAGASATRAADVPSLTGQAAAIALLAKGAFFQTNSIGGTVVNNRQMTFSGGAYMAFAKSTQLNITNGTNTAAATIGSSGTYTNVVRSAYGFDASSMTAIANGGTKGTSANAWSSNTGTIYLGDNGTGIRSLNGYMQRFALSLTKGAFDSRTA